MLALDDPAAAGVLRLEKCAIITDGIVEKANYVYEKYK
jgi:hypothetical protein